MTTQTEHIFDPETNNEIIKTHTSGRSCGTIITTRSVNDDKNLIWHSEIIGLVDYFKKEISAEISEVFSYFSSYYNVFKIYHRNN